MVAVVINLFHVFLVLGFVCIVRPLSNSPLQFQKKHVNVNAHGIRSSLNDGVQVGDWKGDKFIHLAEGKRDHKKGMAYTSLLSSILRFRISLHFIWISIHERFIVGNISCHSS